MKIMFLVQGVDVAASRYRVLQYLPYLKEHGVAATVKPFPKGIFNRLRFYRNARKYDILFIQRKRFSVLWLWYIKRNANRIVYDFDDSVMNRNSKAINPESTTRERMFRNIINISDHVIAGNRYLKENTLAYTNNITIIPSPIDMTSYTEKEYSESNDTVTLGWIGATGSIHYMKKMIPIFEALGGKHGNLRLKIVCDVFFDCENITVDKKQWSAEEEVEDLKSFDIGLMPLMDDPWSHGKCGLKILQCLAVGVPVVCSPVGINKEIVEDGVHGLWASTPEEWIKKIEILINDHNLRKRMGIEGRKRR